MTKKPHDWQQSALARFARAAYFSIVADCGCGKTLAAIMIALKKRMPVIVIAPGHRLCEQWKNDILEAAEDEADVWVYSRPDETKQGEYYKERFEEWLKK